MKKREFNSDFDENDRDVIEKIYNYLMFRRWHTLLKTNYFVVFFVLRRRRKGVRILSPYFNYEKLRKWWRVGVCWGDFALLVMGGERPRAADQTIAEYMYIDLPDFVYFTRINGKLVEPDWNAIRTFSREKIRKMWLDLSSELDAAEKREEKWGFWFKIYIIYYTSNMVINILKEKIAEWLIRNGYIREIEIVDDYALLL